MKRILFTLCACTLIISNLFAQSDEGRFSPIQLTLLYPLGTNGAAAYRYGNGLSINLLAGLSRNESALALGGLANIVLNDTKGVQIAGLYNHTGRDARGFVLSGLAAFTGGHHHGVQLSGLANLAHKVSGLQFAGLINVAHKVSGLQFAGLINVAGKVRGVQFAGLINIAEESDYPIGVINIIRNGEQGIAVGYNETGGLSITYRSGGGVTYGIIGGGYSLKAGRTTYLVEGGLGAHIHLSNMFRLNNELKFETLYAGLDNATFKAAYSLLPACKLARHIEIFAGPSLNYMFSNDADNAGMFPSHSLWKKHEGASLRQVFVGYQLGLQYLF
ncbi:MAG: hypothetical protein LBD21_10435 [Tannerellaceae bacterium]|jgi:hypothetical protein|nr:hypothetical protein [Tannerellaceae bacterium]